MKWDPHCQASIPPFPRLGNSVFQPTSRAMTRIIRVRRTSLLCTYYCEPVASHFKSQSFIFLISKEGNKPNLGKSARIRHDIPNMSRTYYFLNMAYAKISRKRKISNDRKLDFFSSPMDIYEKIWFRDLPIRKLSSIYKNGYQII